jgi:hypothetical protein
MKRSVVNTWPGYQGQAVETQVHEAEGQGHGAEEQGQMNEGQGQKEVSVSEALAKVDGSSFVAGQSEASLTVWGVSPVAGPASHKRLTPISETPSWISPPNFRPGFEPRRQKTSPDDPVGVNWKMTPTLAAQVSIS